MVETAAAMLSIRPIKLSQPPITVWTSVYGAAAQALDVSLKY